MQGLLPAVSAPRPLSLSNLAQHTQQDGLAPRRTVQLYLHDQRTIRGRYELGPPPADEFEGVGEVPHFAGQARRAGPSRETARDTALVLHGLDDADDFPAGSSSRKPAKKSKPSLVSALRPRLSSLPSHSSSPMAAPTKGGNVLVVAEEAVPEAGPSRASPILLARMERKDKPSRVEQAHDEVAPAPAFRQKKGRGDEKADKENAGVKADKLSAKKKGKLRAEVQDEAEAEELEDRLRARRERRANKAFIRKDRSQTAAAVGAAAASKVKKASKRAAAAASDASSGSGSEPPVEKSTKKKRSSAELESRAKLQELQRPINISGSRLTLKPPKQLGIFNKGKASTRTKVGKHLPDLAFSELHFLNGPRPSTPSSSSSSSDSKNAPFGKDKSKHAQPRTYGSKRKSRPSAASKKRALDAAFSDSASASSGIAPLPSPKAKAQAKKRAATTATPKDDPPPARGKRRSSGLVFSHVEVPAARPSLRSNSSSCACSPAPDKRDQAGPASTDWSALSAASLARRRSLLRDSQAAAPSPLAQPSLHRAATQAGGDEAFGGGFDGDEGDAFQPGPVAGRVNAPASSAIGTAALERLIDEARTASAASDAPTFQSPQLAAHSAGALPSSAVAATFSYEDGYIHLRPPALPVSQVESAAPAADLLRPASAHFSDSSHNGASFGRLPSDGQSVSLSALADSVDVPADKSGAPSFLHPGDPIPFPSLSSLPPSALPASLASVDLDDPAAAPASSAPASDFAFLRSDGLGGDAAAVGDLQDEATYREAMRRQWPRARC
ncbi:hypothetical protein JCM10207_006619 [Rhodosporidiobolus poonsookiae]